MLQGMPVSTVDVRAHLLACTSYTVPLHRPHPTPSARSHAPSLRQEPWQGPCPRGTARWLLPKHVRPRVPGIPRQNDRGAQACPTAKPALQSHNLHPMRGQLRHCSGWPANLQGAARRSRYLRWCRASLRHHGPDAGTPAPRPQSRSGGRTAPKMQFQHCHRGRPNQTYSSSSLHASPPKCHELLLRLGLHATARTGFCQDPQLRRARRRCPNRREAQQCLRRQRLPQRRLRQQRGRWPDLGQPLPSPAR
mmetsp:Transcript_89607/g.148485  ORF Transcript_89607/g.148485 Transcript_89607/m.148485 type:complete len:250 (+) Transcript_89607:384-1133(+)